MAGLTSGGSLEERLATVRARIAAAAARGGRSPEDVTLVAVTKAHPVDVVLDAVAAGAVDLGENRAQELRDKAMVAGRDEIRWHFIGHLQTNKVRLVVGTAVLIHSVDTFGLAEAIGRRARHLGTPQELLIQVDLAAEASKAGVAPTRAVSLAKEVAGIDGVVVKGLMTIPPIPAAPEDSRPYFQQLAELSEDLREAVPGAGELSMGMTRDFEVAIEEGATIVRVGEAIFGPRPTAP
ncbi:MAG: YggS family pyridoxal phosphate-dependent enzyme [Actinobacteria bacterium]|nr:YggS family pyridoxal phosphate-dependent enzyme [Actinomycetota bacterium]